MRLYASAANGRKNGKNRATVNNNTSNNNNNTNDSTAKKLTQNASGKAAQSNFANKQQSQPIKAQSTTIKVDENSKFKKPATTILNSLNVKENAQNKPNEENKGKSPAKIVKCYNNLFGRSSKFCNARHF